MNNLTLLPDKSALQGLSPREAKWLFHHFRVNLPPVFFSELLADLTKAKPKSATAEGDVQSLARKITSHSLSTNGGAEDLMWSELHARRTPLDGRPADSRAELLQMENGEKAIYLDATPTQEMLDRWVAGDFSQNDRDFAREWRDGISKIKLEETFRQSKELRRAEVRSRHDIHKVVESVLAGRDYHLIHMLYDLAGAPSKVMSQAIIAWRKMGKPSVSEFFPYSYLILRIELYFLIGLANQVITTRDTNRIDIEYLKYLPFTLVFTSSDALHMETAQHFLLGHNAFIPGAELKQALAEIADHWEAVDEETRKRGTATYADLPPVNLDNVITRLYDRYMPNWREGANKPRPPISAEESERLMKQIRPKMEEIQRLRKDPKARLN